MSVDLVNVVCLSGTAGVMFLGAVYAFTRWRKEWWVGLVGVVVGLLFLLAGMVQNLAIALSSSSQVYFIDRQSDMLREAGLGLIWLVVGILILQRQRQRLTPSLTPTAALATRFTVVFFVLMAFIQLARAFGAYRFLQSMSKPTGFFP